MTDHLSTIHLTASQLPDVARNDFEFWRSLLEPLLSSQPLRIMAALAEIAQSTSTPLKTIQRKYYAARKHGIVALIDKRLAGPKWWKTEKQITVSEADKELVRLYCGTNQRSSRSAVKKLRRDWQRGLVKTETPIKPETGFPRGWSIENLCRFAPPVIELKAVRIGRSAAASHRPLVYTTRKGLWAGSHYMLDDMWHDFEINTFAERQSGRPLELFSHDLFSARKVRWGIRVRTRRDDGSHNQLSERMARFILAATLFLDGYSPRGTVIIAEHGTAAVREEIERALYNMSDGKITVARSGMEGAAAHAGQYPGIARGNFRFKASLESSNNLTHNVFAALPGQTGKDRDHQPEEHPALMKNNDDLLAARNYLSPERAALLEFPILELNQFMGIAAELYRAIEDDPDHELEGWIECGHVEQELLLGGQWISQSEILGAPELGEGGRNPQSDLALAMIRAGTLQSRPRRMTRGEVWRAGASELTRIPGYGVCSILGDDLASERKVRSNMFEFEDREVGPGVHRYEAVAKTPFGEELRLNDGDLYETFVNPFAPETLFVRRANGAYIGECRRITKPCRADAEAVHRRCGEVAKTESELLQPIRTRHLQDARQKLSRHERNAAILSGRPLTAPERNTRNRFHEIARDLTEAQRAAFIGREQISRAESGDREVAGGALTASASARDSFYGAESHLREECGVGDNLHSSAPDISPDLISKYFAAPPTEGEEE
jgi:hypothetical protein